MRPFGLLDTNKTREHPGQSVYTKQCCFDDRCNKASHVPKTSPRKERQGVQKLFEESKEQLTCQVGT